MSGMPASEPAKEGTRESPRVPENMKDREAGFPTLLLCRLVLRLAGLFEGLPRLTVVGVLRLRGLVAAALEGFGRSGNHDNGGTSQNGGCGRSQKQFLKKKLTPVGFNAKLRGR